MTEPNWATDEMHRWLSSSEGAYNEIMSAPQDKRPTVLKRIAAQMMTSITNFTDEDFQSIEWDVLARDFAGAPEPIAKDGTGPRYAHACNACTYLGRYNEADLYWHRDGSGMYSAIFVFAHLPNSNSIIMPPEDIKMMEEGLLLAQKRGLT